MNILGKVQSEERDHTVTWAGEIYNKELLTIMRIGVIRDYVISSKENFKEYRDSRYREQPALLESLRISTLRCRPCWTECGRGSLSGREWWNLWKPVLLVARECCSSGVVLPEALLYDTTWGAAGGSGWLVGMAGRPAVEEPGTREAGLRGQEPRRKTTL